MHPSLNLHIYPTQKNNAYPISEASKEWSPDDDQSVSHLHGLDDEGPVNQQKTLRTKSFYNESTEFVEIHEGQMPFQRTQKSKSWSSNPCRYAETTTCLRYWEKKIVLGTSWSVKRRWEVHLFTQPMPNKREFSQAHYDTVKIDTIHV